MAFKMSPIGKNKCSYSPMKEKGLISPMLNESTVYVLDSSTGKKTKLTKKDGSYYKANQVVTLNKSQKEVSPSKPKVSSDRDPVTGKKKSKYNG
tara:strand:+ start:477 stop:758 length:282 start_codon:yes stop_codon:yes gene_type:complete